MNHLLHIHRRAMLASSAAFALCGALPNPLRAQAAAAGNSLAGQVGVWALGQIGSYGAKLGLTEALNALGFDQSSGVNARLDEINNKLDQVLTQLEVLNSRLNDISRQITGLMNAIDIGFKDISAQIDQTGLKDDFAEIDRCYGSRASASNANLFGLIRLSPSGQPNTQAIQNFKEHRDDVNGALHRIHAQLTYSAGSSDPLIQKWASLLIARMHAAGPDTSLDPYARVMESWFVDAISRQLRGTAVLLFCDGSDKASQAATRQECGSMVAEECEQYVNAMERMALTWSRPAPSGPTRSPERVAWMPGAKEWLLRADVLARALKVAFEPPSGRDMSEQDMAVRLSGCYGRVLMRASDVAAKRGTVSLTAFSVADPDTKAENAEARAAIGPLRDWPEAAMSITGTPGPVTEFNSTEWDVSYDLFARLTPRGASSLQFVRGYWPLPQNPVKWGPNPIAYWEQRLDKSQLRNGRSGMFVLGSVLRPDGMWGGIPHTADTEPAPRIDGAVTIYSLADLAPFELREQTYFMSGLPFMGSVSGGPPQPLLFIVSFLDGWSRVAQGPEYPQSRTEEQTTIKAQPLTVDGPQVISADVAQVLYNTGHPLQFAAIDWRMALRPATSLRGTFMGKCVAFAGQCRPYRATTQFQVREHFVYNSTAHSVAPAPLFSTGAGENGTLLLFMRGSVSILRMYLTYSPRAVTRSRVKLRLSNDKDGETVPLFDSFPAIDTQTWPDDRNSSAETDFVVNFVPVVLKENRKYSLVQEASIELGADGESHSGDRQFTEVVDLVLAEFGVVRAPWSG